MTRLRTFPIPLHPRTAAAVAVACVLATGAAAADARTPSVYGSPLLWATVNACDTAGRPDTVGIRASMPGSGVRGERMFVRLRLQFRDGAGDWRPVGAGGDSGWIALGAADVSGRQAGTDFTLRPPSSGSVLLRGLAVFEWRRGDEVVRRARKRTAGGHPGTPGSDPAGFSAAVCELD
jgi:hypothetical protein